LPAIVISLCADKRVGAAAKTRRVVVVPRSVSGCQIPAPPRKLVRGTEEASYEDPVADVAGDLPSHTFGQRYLERQASIHNIGHPLVKVAHHVVDSIRPYAPAVLSRLGQKARLLIEGRAVELLVGPKVGISAELQRQKVWLAGVAAAANIPAAVRVGGALGS
jgi:hypothetical protein